MIILFIDDDPDDYELFCEALKIILPGAECLQALDGAKALKILNGLAVLPDYIFLDVNMPVMGGKEVLTKIKENKKFKDIPVIVYSTTTNQGEIAAFKKLGADHFLIKPSSYIALQNHLRELIRSR